MKKVALKSIKILALVTLLNFSACDMGDSGNMKLSQDTQAKHSNHLAGESSPYLLSHADNPVDWYPWGPEALAKAKKEDKPIFLSIGYAACHWCHVMEHESFENPQIAAILNEHFVSIKVDREQRPDLDQIYMSFTTALTGHGGWPMSVFLTPNLKPFFAGTYFPPEDRFGSPGFKRLVTEIARAYDEEKETIFSSSEDIFEKVTQRLKSVAAARVISKDMIRKSAETLMSSVDSVYGGFGSQPKFPHATELSLFMRHYKSTGDLSYLNAAEAALRAMAKGGIYDHIGGGFARYSTDQRWLVPHFEKMLYDNALLVPAYVEAYQITGNEFYQKVVIQTLDFILREMTDQSGGFYSALDADSEGEEGKFYVWTKDEIENLLENKANAFISYYNVTEDGNFEEKNILHITNASDRISTEFGADRFEVFIADARRRLLEARNKRVRPLTDDKILTSWNGLALSAFCKGYRVTGIPRYLEAAVANATFIKDSLYRDGNLTHAYREGRHSGGQFLEDYAYLIRGLLDLYETDHAGQNLQWLEFAAELARKGIDMFMDSSGSFYLRPDYQADLIVRPKDETDGATPAPGSIMISNLLRLNRITADQQFLAAAETGLKAVSGMIEANSGGMSAALFAVDYYLNDKIEIVITGQGPQRDEMLSELYRRYMPNGLVAFSSAEGEHPALFEGRLNENGQVRAYICVNSVCDLPVSSVEELKQQLNGI